MNEYKVCTTCRMVTPVEAGACAYYDQDHAIEHELDLWYS